MASADLQDQPSRRAADGRLAALEKRVGDVADKVDAIRDMLISEPAMSPLGRRLQSQHDELRADFESFLTERFRPIEKWWDQVGGAQKVLVGISIILGVVGTFLGIANWFGFGPS